MANESPASLLAAAGLFLVLGTFFVGLRFYCRRSSKLRLGFDDWLILPANFLLLLLSVNMIVGVHLGVLAVPQLPLRNSEGEIDYVRGTSTQLTRAVKLGLVKLSILFFLRRIFCSGIRSWFWHATNILITLNIFWAVAFFWSYLFQCGTNFYRIWGPLDDYVTHCLNDPMLELVFAWTDCLLDVASLLLPIPMIWGLHTSRKRKMTITLIFLVGGMTVAASIIRLVIVSDLINGITSNFVSDTALGFITSGLYWGIIESGLSVIVACLPITHHFAASKAGLSITSGVRSVASLRRLLKRDSLGQQINSAYLNEHVIVTEEVIITKQASYELAHPDR